MIQIKKLATEIARREGRKSQTRIGDIREILGILSDIWFESTEGYDHRIFVVAKDFVNHGKRRAKRKKVRK